VIVEDVSCYDAFVRSRFVHPLTITPVLHLTAPLAADVASSSLQCQLAVENLCVAASQLLSLIRTLRLSILLMDEETIAAEEEWQVLQVQAITEKAEEKANEIERGWMELRNQELKNKDGEQ
jgi:hypothetical protein